MGIETGTNQRLELGADLGRAWQDLDAWRLGLGLAAAPVLPVIIGCLLICVVSDGPVTPLGALLYFIILLVFATIWSLAFGAFYLVTSPRRSGMVTRAQCIFIGGLAAAPFPLILTLFWAAIQSLYDPAGAAFVAVIGLTTSVLVGMFLIPLGVLGGWVFWIIGIKPAKKPTGAIGHIFG